MTPTSGMTGDYENPNVDRGPSITSLKPHYPGK